MHKADDKTVQKTFFGTFKGKFLALIKKIPNFTL